jgi:hypothetical protein
MCHKFLLLAELNFNKYSELEPMNCSFSEPTFHSVMGLIFQYTLHISPAGTVVSNTKVMPNKARFPAGLENSYPVHPFIQLYLA